MGAQAFTLDKEDGEYSIQVELEGGSGKASVTSPTLITVKNGEVTADIQWSSSNYDYMIVDGKKSFSYFFPHLNSIIFIIPQLKLIVNTSLKKLPC